MQTGPKSNPLKEWLDKGARIAGKYYDWGAGCLAKVNRLLDRLPFLARLEQRLSKRRLILAFELFVAVSLTVSFFFLVRPTCRMGPDGDTLPKAVFSYLSKRVDPVVKQQIPISWRMRLAGPITAGELLDVTRTPVINGPAFENMFGLYHATWLFLLFLLLVARRQDALFIMFGIMSGLMYYLSDPVKPQFFVWDIANMFFFTLACFLFSTRRMWLLMLVVWVGALFKETTLCCALLILLSDQWPWCKRLFGFVTTVILTFASYKILMWLYHMNSNVFAMNQASSFHDLIWKSVLAGNVHTLFSLDPRSVLFANAGGLFLMMLLPWKNRRDVVFKLLIISYIIGEFFWGIISEFRIWYEVLPLGWIIISEAWSNARPEAAETTSAASRALKGSYWLMMTALLVMAAIVCLATKPPPKEVIAGQAKHMTVTELLVAASSGNIEAQFRLGTAFENGVGIEKDEFEAAHWYRLAAEKGHLDSQTALGVLLFDQKDYVNAAQWFQKAAAAGNSNAAFDLGVLYQRGWGVQQDLISAYQWLKLAQLQGNEQAATELSACTARMTPEQITEAEKRALNFPKEAK